jgi:hypothetical protein
LFPLSKIAPRLGRRPRRQAGLLTLDPNALCGALLFLASGAGDPQQVRAWAALGGRAFARDTRLEDEKKEPLALTFPAPLGSGTFQPPASADSGAREETPAGARQTAAQ